MMQGRKLLSALFLVLTGLFMSLALSQCGVKQPKVENTKFSSPVADHTRFTDGCAACHEYRRLAPTVDLVTVPHGFGRECGECHQYLATGPTWDPKFYAHNPAPKACLGCHNLPGKMAELNKPNAHSDGTKPGQLRGECATCHSYPDWAKIGASGG